MGVLAELREAPYTPMPQSQGPLAWRRACAPVERIGNIVVIGGPGVKAFCGRDKAAASFGGAADGGRGCSGRARDGGTGGCGGGGGG
eukprot:scaffold135543_cov133-Phaeocystis_antarctica.AAC.1